jgi:hypothetical protein
MHIVHTRRIRTVGPNRKAALLAVVAATLTIGVGAGVAMTEAPPPPPPIEVPDTLRTLQAAYRAAGLFEIAEAFEVESIRRAATRLREAVQKSRPDHKAAR